MAFSKELSGAGFRADRVSVWALQVWINVNKCGVRAINQLCTNARPQPSDSAMHPPPLWIPPALPPSSMYVRQGLPGMGMGLPGASEILTEVTNMAAFNSLVFGELPLATRREAQVGIQGLGGVDRFILVLLSLSVFTTL